MLTPRTPISVAEAVQKVMEHVPAGKTEVVPLQEARGRYLAEKLVADHPIPMFDRSMYDGFAIRAEDTRRNGSNDTTVLKVIEAVPAGYEAQQTLARGQAVRIMTGAAIPLGADAVVMLEDVEELKQNGADYIRLDKPVQAGQYISKQGEDTPEGTVLAEKGRRIGAGEQAMLATFGYARVRVYRKPVVGIFATGSELLPVDAPLQPGKIRNSNSYMLESQIEQLGAVPRYYGILKDDFDLCYGSVLQALEEVDYLITTGGASVGDYDFVQKLLDELGMQVLFNKVAMRPGSVTTVAHKDGKWIFGLSGNPAACFIGFEFFARPVLQSALGADYHLPRTKAILAHDIPTSNRFTRFMRAKLSIRGSQVVASTVGLDKSGVVSALIQANGLLVVPEGDQGFSKGTEMDVIWLDKWIQQSILPANVER